MNAQELLRGQFEQAHQLLEGTIGDVEAAILNHRDEAWKINPIGAIYSHVAIAEDAMVNGMALGREPLLARGGWGGEARHHRDVAPPGRRARRFCRRSRNGAGVRAGPSLPRRTTSSAAPQKRC